MAMPPKVALDPFRALISPVDDVDTLRLAANAAGLAVDLTLAADRMWTHLTMVRELTPRIFAAYDALSDRDKVVASQAAYSAMRAGDQVVADRATQALARIGWQVQGANIVAATADLREMFFPRGSQWDAFVVLRTIFAEAQTDLTIVDAYCDGTVCQLIAACDLAALRVQVLCSRHAEPLRAEANRFTQQHPGVIFEIRRTRDFHDRFVVLDASTCIHVGASLNAAGTTAFMVSRVEDESNRLALLAQVHASWNGGTVVP